MRDVTDEGIFARTSHHIRRRAEKTASKLLAEYERDAGNDRESLLVLAGVCAEVLNKILNHRLGAAEPLWILMMQATRSQGDTFLCLLVEQVDKAYEGAVLPKPPWSIEIPNHPPVRCLPEVGHEAEKTSGRPSLARGLCVIFDDAEDLGEDVAAEAFEKFVIDNAKLPEGHSVAALTDKEEQDAKDF